jgi:hypothetical protein
MKQFLVMPGSKNESKECLMLWFVRNGEGYIEQLILKIKPTSETICLIIDKSYLR